VAEAWPLLLLGTACWLQCACIAIPLLELCSVIALMLCWGIASYPVCMKAVLKTAGMLCATMKHHHRSTSRNHSQPMPLPAPWVTAQQFAITTCPFWSRFACIAICHITPSTIIVSSHTRPMSLPVLDTQLSKLAHSYTAQQACPQLHVLACAQYAAQQACPQACDDVLHR